MYRRKKEEKPAVIEESTGEEVEKLEKKLDKTVQMFTLDTLPPLEKISTGSLRLDECLEGGFSLGWMSVLWGPPGSGKSTIAMEAAANCTRLGHKVLWLDAERALKDKKYPERMGVVSENFEIMRAVTLDDALIMLRAKMTTGDYRMVVVDSLQGLPTKNQLENALAGKSAIASQTRLWGDAAMIYGVICDTYNFALVFINQARQNTGDSRDYEPYKMTGGESVKHRCSLVIEVDPADKLMQGEERIGVNALLKIIKRRHGVKYLETKVPIIFGYGVYAEKELIEMCIKEDLITVSGSWYKYGEEKVQGMESLINLFKNDENLYNDYYNLLRAKLNLDNNE